MPAALCCCQATIPSAFALRNRGRGLTLALPRDSFMPMIANPERGFRKGHPGQYDGATAPDRLPRHCAVRSRAGFDRSQAGDGAACHGSCGAGCRCDPRGRGNRQTAEGCALRACSRFEARDRPPVRRSGLLAPGARKPARHHAAIHPDPAGRKRRIICRRGHPAAFEARARDALSLRFYGGMTIIESGATTAALRRCRIFIAMFRRVFGNDTVGSADAGA